MGTPWAAGDVVYVMSKEGQLICIERATGLIYWIREMSPKETGPNAGRSGFLGLGNNVNTRVYWTGVILASNRLITVSSTGLARALDPKTGQTLGQIKLGAPALITPIAVGNYVYVMLDNGKLVAIR
jgi:outer membrane protein assembly factor BamB